MKRDRQIPSREKPLRKGPKENRGGRDFRKGPSGGERGDRHDFREGAGGPEARRFGKPNEPSDHREGRESAKLRDRRNRRIAVERPEPEEREDLLAGRQPVMEALKSGRAINKLVVAKGAREGSIREILGMARDRGIPITELERTVLDREVRHHQGIIAHVAPVAYVEVEEILEKAKAKGEPPFVLLLDGLEDPHNIGALLRTAEGAGAHGVIIPKRRGGAITSTVAKASAGAVEYVPIARVTNLVQTVGQLKKAGLWIIGSAMDAPRPYFRQDFRGPVGLIVGSEGKGISPLLREHCDHLVSIPMGGKVDSLNASVAGALLMYERVRQLQEGVKAPQ
ncbi:23S rRNA (guanosine(2251)-2'-O)-methyltransferase RlmB [Heliomicrobium modesticaldum]|uniref:23S rRNA (guanosine(2251)-2'-O)-methyltransferase RlmB n=1 Tax=Heliomicrobium modesticaldum TaxID=35701 RepID=UPI0002FC8A04|nr:23S rRNA (guanosine(2251)-2'-O)-methyltransferase RlmB [Heliomicrobium modesticaldum]